MWAYLDSIPEANFAGLIIGIIAFAYVAEWAFRKWVEEDER